MKINDSDLKEILKNNEIDQDKQARIIGQPGQNQQSTTTRIAIKIVL